MKKQWYFVLFFVLFSLQATAQDILAGNFRHVIDVQAFPYYGKGFLTITNAHYYKIGESQERVNITYDYTDPLHMGGEVVPLSLIVAVDGVSAEGWTPEQFYQVVDGRKDSIRLRLRTHKNGEIVEYDTEITPRYELPDFLKIYGWGLSDNTLINTTDAKDRAMKSYAVFNVIFDKEFDFFNVRFYDYYITGGDPLLDKEILANVDYNGAVILPKDKEGEKPEVLITIAKDVNQRIEAVYVPPTSRTVQTGSYTISSYNSTTNQTTAQTHYQNRTIREAGYTTDVGNTDLFLEIAALDYSKINDPSITYTPVIWKATATRHVSTAYIKADEHLKSYATWMVFGPFDDRIRIISNEILYEPLGVIGSYADPSIIGSVMPYSRAEALGLQVGDKLVKLTGYKAANIKKKISVLINHPDWNYSGWNTFKRAGSSWKYRDIEPFIKYEIVYERNGKKYKIIYNAHEHPLKVSTCFVWP